MASTRHPRSRRPRGTGSIQRRVNADGSQTYYAVVRHGGKPVWRKAGPTADDAQRLLNELLADRQRGDASRLEGGMAFDDYARLWLGDFKLSARKPSTKSDYDRIVVKVLIPHFERRPLHLIKRAEVQQLVNRRLKGEPLGTTTKWSKPVSVKTAMNEVAVLRKVLNDARDIDEQPTGTPWQHLVVPAHDGRERVELKGGQVQALIAATPPKHETLMRLLAYLGLRIGEALALVWDDFDERRQTLRIERSWSHSKIVAPKSDAGSRTLRLSDDLAHELSRRRQPPRGRTTATGLLYGGKQAGPKYPDNPLGLIFPGPRGGYMDPANWRKTVFHPAKEKARLPRATVPHSLRHTAAVAMLAAGHPMDRVRATLGHNTIGITMDLYGKRSAGEFEGAADVMGRL